MSNDLRIDGVIPINKSAGLTSHDVVAKLRRILGTKKVGHTGTLDPQVTGVLPICVGKATRLSDYIMEMPKTYQGQLILGIATSTQDFTGNILEQKKVESIDSEKIISTFEKFIGEIDQIPPMYSAVKIDGKKLYELAREGKDIERKPRKVTIYNLSIDKLYIENEYPKIDFTVCCSKGTYIRTLCVDIGMVLGYPAHMSKLVRLESGSFTIKESFSIEEVEDYFNNEKVKEIVTTMADCLPNYPEVVFSEEDINQKIFNGQRVETSSKLVNDGLFKVIDNKRNLCAIYKKESNTKYATPIKVFK